MFQLFREQYSSSLLIKFAPSSFAANLSPISIRAPRHIYPASSPIVFNWNLTPNRQSLTLPNIFNATFLLNNSLLPLLRGPAWLLCSLYCPIPSDYSTNALLCPFYLIFLPINEFVGRAVVINLYRLNMCLVAMGCKTWRDFGNWKGSLQIDKYFTQDCSSFKRVGWCDAVFIGSTRPVRSSSEVRTPRLSLYLSFQIVTRNNSTKS